MLLPRIFYWTFGSVSFILLTIAAAIFFYGQKAQDQYTKVVGTVIKNQYKGDMARPVIRYSLDGKELLYVANTYTSPPAYERDEKVELFVNPNDPQDVWINTFMGRYFVMTLLGGMGLLFLGFLVLFHFAFKKH